MNDSHWAMRADEWELWSCVIGLTTAIELCEWTSSVQVVHWLALSNLAASPLKPFKITFNLFPYHGLPCKLSSHHIRASCCWRPFETNHARCLCQQKKPTWLFQINVECAGPFVHPLWVLGYLKSVCVRVCMSAVCAHACVCACLCVRLYVQTCTSGVHTHATREWYAVCRWTSCHIHLLGFFHVALQFHIKHCMC